MYQVKVFNPVTTSFKMIGPTCASIRSLELIAKKAIIQLYNQRPAGQSYSSLMVRIVAV